MRNGFSLVELSIVLVILGLLTGGILTGQNLIRAAELRSVTTEFQGYQTAVNTFRDKYFAIPGDMRNATDFWGQMTNCGAASPSGTGTDTCNGDGSGTVDLAAAASQTGEEFGFWQHLANAGLIEGTYTGIAGTAAYHDYTFGENVPRSKLSSAAWAVSYQPPTFTGSTAAFAGSYSNFFSFGAKVANSSNEGALLTPEEAWNIDTKVDDGMPGKGKILARYWDDLCAVAASNTDYDAPYKLSDSSAQCALYFVRAF